ncbi:MAG: L,D-transpeptidase [Candidatus Nomurabacteria bacterium]
MNIKNKQIKVNYHFLNTTLLIILLFILIGYFLSLNKEKTLKQNIQNTSDNIYSDYKYLDKLISTNISPISLTQTSSSTTDTNGVTTTNNQYVKIINSCSIHFDGDCVRARACPGLNCPTIASLRDEMVLETDGEVTQADGISWYHIVFSEWVRYPERTAKDWYISSDYLELINSLKEKSSISDANKIVTNKKIIVNLTEQKLYAYEGDKLFVETLISSGLDDLPTPVGTFHIFSKTPSRYMQGPLPDVSDQYYDLPGVPWTMYFTGSGAAIHGAYWHNSFGSQWSHGCVNLSPEEAEKLYSWTEVGTTVIVKN